MRGSRSTPTASLARLTSCTPARFSCSPLHRESLGRLYWSISFLPHMRLHLVQGIRLLLLTSLACGRLAKSLAFSTCGCVTPKAAFTTRQNRACAIPAQRLTIRSSRTRFAGRLNSGVRPTLNSMATGLVSFLTFLLGLLLGNWLAIGRDKRKEFNEAGSP